MQMTDNTILITGGASGIGRALAEAFHALGNEVIIAGRRQALLHEATAVNPGMASRKLDVENVDDIKKFAEAIKSDYPALNAVIHSAVIMLTENLQTDSVTAAEQTVSINLLGPIRLNAALLPLLLMQPRASIMTVSSGLAFVPLALNSSYCVNRPVF